MEALQVSCLEGVRPPEEQVQRLRELAQTAPERQVQRYLEESTCCFAAGAYSAAIVVGWCAVARYLRMVIEALGFDVARRYYRDEEKLQKPIPELAEWDGRPLYTTSDRMNLFPNRLDLMLKDFWTKRCRYAHPHGEFATTPEEVLRFLTDAEWLLTRTVAQERLQRLSVVLECAEDPLFDLDEDRARRLIQWVREDQRESLATVVLSKFLSADRSIAYEKLMALWEALKLCLSDASRIRLMEKLAEGLSDYRSRVEHEDPNKRPPPMDTALDVVQMAQLVFWNEAHDQTAIWGYFDERLTDDLMNRRIAAQLKQYAPSPYRERAEAAWPNV